MKTLTEIEVNEKTKKNVSRSDESNCVKKQDAWSYNIFIDCGDHGYQCGPNMCISYTYWCAAQIEFFQFVLFYQTCPDLFQTLHSERLCTNQTFWMDRKCPRHLPRCSGNWPGQCADTVRVSERVKRALVKVPVCTDSLCKDNSQRVCNESSHVYGPWQEACDKTEMHWCEDNSTCIHQDLLCDGYLHCPDGSDELESICSTCPRTIGYPPEKLSAATFACKHRYTGRWICSVPCDGHDDLCEDFADEDCDPASKYFISLAVAFVLILIVIIGEFFLKNIKAFDQLKRTDNEMTTIKSMHDPHQAPLENIILFENSNSTKKRRQLEAFKKVLCCFN